MKRRKAVLLIGASGFLGSHLAFKLREGFKVFATHYRKYFAIPGVSQFPADALDRDWVKRLVYAIQPDVIIYCAGSNELRRGELDPRETERVHAGGPVSVLTASEILAPKFIMISNSYVFEGSRGNYKETDVVLPETQLGKSKLRSENVIKGKSLNHVIVRSANVFGLGNGYNLSQLDQIRMKLEKGQKFEVSDMDVQNYAPVYGLVDLIIRLVDGGPKNKILHYGGLTKVSQYEFAKRFAKFFGYDPSLILPGRPEHLKKMGEKAVFDYSLNFTETVNTLKVKPFLLEEGFDLLKQKLLTRT